MLHGLDASKQLFDRFFSEKTFEPYSLLSVDLLGFGESDKPTNFSYELRLQADLVSQLIHSLKIKRVILVGHSMGGMIGTLLLPLLKDVIVAFISLEGNLTLEDCGLSREAVQQSFEEFQKTYQATSTPDFVFYRSAVSIVSLAKSSELLGLFQSAPCPELLLIGEKSHFRSRPEGTHLQIAIVPKSGHFMLTENYLDSLRMIEQFLSKL